MDSGQGQPEPSGEGARKKEYLELSVKSFLWWSEDFGFYLVHREALEFFH